LQLSDSQSQTGFFKESDLIRFGEMSLVEKQKLGHNSPGERPRGWPARKPDQIGFFD
jgi:hypothetical protein